MLFTLAIICDTLTLKRDIAKGYCNSLSGNGDLQQQQEPAPFPLQILKESAEGDFMIILKAILWLMFLPFKLLFWWLPKESDSYDKNDEEYLFWKEHGHDW